MTQYKIGIIGTENSHAMAFAKYFNFQQEGNKYENFRVTALYGDYPGESEKIAKECNVDFVSKSADELLDKVDAVMVCARDGKYHYKFAKPFVDAGIPLFLDKPTTIDAAETVELLKAAKEKKVPVCGGSVFKYSHDIQAMKSFVDELGDDICSGFVAAPLFMQSPYSGFYFYAAHLTEIVMSVFGCHPESISATRKGNSIAAQFNYEKFSVTGCFNDYCPDYSCAVFEKNGAHIKEIELIGCQKTECESFAEMVKTGELPFDFNRLAAPIFIMNAVEKAYKTGECINVNYTEI